MAWVVLLAFLGSIMFFVVIVKKKKIKKTKK